MKRRSKSRYRGNTAKGRLALLDQASLHLLPATNGAPLRAVDVGIGASAITTMEWSQALSAADISHVMTGNDENASFVQSAQLEGLASEDAAASDIQFVTRADWDQSAERWDVLRAMNVLRGYKPEQLKAEQLALLRRLKEGGIAMEGTSDAEGDILTAHLWRRTDNRTHYLGLLLTISGKRPFAPRMLRDFLPRDLRRRAGGHELVWNWLQDWQFVHEELPAALRQSPIEAFIESTRALSRRAPETCRLLSVPQGQAAIVWTPCQPSLAPEVLRSGEMIS